jgi:hypothetical protein
MKRLTKFDLDQLSPWERCEYYQKLREEEELEADHRRDVELDRKIEERE